MPQRENCAMPNKKLFGPMVCHMSLSKALIELSSLRVLNKYNSVVPRSSLKRIFFSTLSNYFYLMGMVSTLIDFSIREWDKSLNFFLWKVHKLLRGFQSLEETTMNYSTDEPACTYMCKSIEKYFYLELYPWGHSFEWEVDRKEGFSMKVVCI